MGWKLSKIAFIVILVVSVSISCLAQSSDQTKSGVAAMIDKYSITKEEVFDLLAKRYRLQTDEVVQELIVKWLIREESKLEGITIRRSLIISKAKDSIAKIQKETRDKLNQSWEEYLKSTGLTEKEFVDEEHEKWKYNLILQSLVRLSQHREEKVEARHILVKTRDKADEILKQLRQNADFVTLAKQLSISQTEDARLPTVHRGDIPYFDKVLFSLQPNEISGVVESPWGFHILQVVEVIPATKATWSQHKSQILDSLEEKPVTPREIQRWFNKMETKYKIRLLYK